MTKLAYITLCLYTICSYSVTQQAHKQDIDYVSLSCDADMHMAEMCIQKWANTQDVQLYTDSNAVADLGYGECNSLYNGEDLIAKSFIKKGGIVIDAGAHIGDWTNLVMQATCMDCTIYAFEPGTDTYRRLVKRFFSKVSCFNVALGKEKAQLELNYFYLRGSNCSTLFNRPDLKNVPVKKIMVPVISLDAFAQEHRINHINFLKIDTEGAEFSILMGAANLIQDQCIDIIQFEYGNTYQDAGVTLSQVYSYLTTNNYLIFRIVPQGLIYIPVWHNDLETFRYSNYLAIKK